MKNKNLPVHSSAAEYLTFVAAIGESNESFEMRYENENIWLTQKMMSALYDVSVSAVNQHIKRIYNDGELTPESTIKKYLIVQNEGDRKVSFDSGQTLSKRLRPFSDVGARGESAG